MKAIIEAVGTPDEEIILSALGGYLGRPADQYFKRGQRNQINFIAASRLAVEIGQPFSETLVEADPEKTKKLMEMWRNNIVLPASNEFTFYTFLWAAGKFDVKDVGRKAYAIAQLMTALEIINLGELKEIQVEVGKSITQVDKLFKGYQSKKTSFPYLATAINFFQEEMTKFLQKKTDRMIFSQFVRMPDEFEELVLVTRLKQMIAWFKEQKNVDARYLLLPGNFHGMFSYQVNLSEEVIRNKIKDKIINELKQIRKEGERSISAEELNTVIEYCFSDMAEVEKTLITNDNLRLEAQSGLHGLSRRGNRVRFTEKNELKLKEAGFEGLTMRQMKKGAFFRQLGITAQEVSERVAYLINIKNINKESIDKTELENQAERDVLGRYGYSAMTIKDRDRVVVFEINLIGNKIACVLDDDYQVHFPNQDLSPATKKWLERIVLSYLKEARNPDEGKVMSANEETTNGPEKKFSGRDAHLRVWSPGYNPTIDDETNEVVRDLMGGKINLQELNEIFERVQKNPATIQDIDDPVLKTILRKLLKRTEDKPKLNYTPLNPVCKVGYVKEAEADQNTLPKEIVCPKAIESIFPK